MYDSLSSLHPAVPGRWQPVPPQACDAVIALVARQKNVPIRLLIHKSRNR